MTILLTEEEILGEDIWLKAGVLAHYALAVKNNREPKEPEELMARRQIAKAQARKLMEKIAPIIELAMLSQKYCEDTYGYDNMARLNVNAGWQDLKKEIG
ncbi:hypothetical protein LCGC14_3117620 [marine sediment metagenome]|uniref:Uncharacterized protein n=1 Tax=marine sediment metagenome TaxID=412755 RepID=A0A0F8W363_9ZZZZ